MHPYRPQSILLHSTSEQEQTEPTPLIGQCLALSWLDLKKRQSCDWRGQTDVSLFTLCESTVISGCGVARVSWLGLLHVIYRQSYILEAMAVDGRITLKIEAAEGVLYCQRPYSGLARGKAKVETQCSLGETEGPG